MSKDKMVTKEVVSAFKYKGKDVVRGDEIEISEANAEIFKHKLCEPGAAEKRKEAQKNVLGKIKALEDENKALKAELAKLSGGASA